MQKRIWQIQQNRYSACGIFADDIKEQFSAKVWLIWTRYIFFCRILQNLKKTLAFFRKGVILSKSDACGSLVKRLRRRPLTAETGVRFPYGLLYKGVRELYIQHLSKVFRRV